MANVKRDIYSISGFFIEDHNPTQGRYFGGFFSLGPDMNRPQTNILAVSFKGLLVDDYGDSEIIGEMCPERMEFIKEYKNEGSRIQYKFEKNKEGIWVGSYLGDSETETGRAFAKTNINWKGVEMMVLIHLIQKNGQGVWWNN